MRIIFVVLLFMIHGCTAYDNRKTVWFNDIVGRYVIDIEKTNLYNHDVNVDSIQKYEQLSITFKSDSTFSMNMQVPFIYDSSGKWIVRGGGFEDWNWLIYNKSEIKTQFDQFKNNDSIYIYLNSVTPRVGQSMIPKIYFKKIM